jgi:hypothetical protein
LPTQVLDDGLQHACIVVNRQEDGPCHKESVEPKTGLTIELLPSTIRLGPVLLTGPTHAMAECISIDEAHWAGSNLVNGLPDPTEGFLIPYFGLKAVISDVAGSVPSAGASDLSGSVLRNRPARARVVAIRDIAKTLVMAPIGTNVGGVSPKRDRG